MGGTSDVGGFCQCSSGTVASDGACVACGSVPQIACAGGTCTERNSALAANGECECVAGAIDEGGICCLGSDYGAGPLAKAATWTASTNPIKAGATFDLTMTVWSDECSPRPGPTTFQIYRISPGQSGVYYQAQASSGLPAMPASLVETFQFSPNAGPFPGGGVTLPAGEYQPYYCVPPAPAGGSCSGIGSTFTVAP